MSSPPRDAAAMGDSPEEHQAAVKRKRNLPGTPDPEAEVIALSPKTLMATNRFLCEVCGKGFQRDQNLQLHRRGHNLPWKLKQRDGQEVKRRVYVCPEASCIHHDPSRALGDLTGIKKHFSRKHGEKKWKCEKCSKQYAVQSDYKAHQKVCGTREYRCDCGTLFSRRDSFTTHRAFCDALAQENGRTSAHRQVETQQLSDTGGNPTTSSGREPSSVVDASPSPFRQQATSEKPSSETLDSRGRETPEANSALSEGRALKGLQGGLASMPSYPLVGPGLSLSLGTGLGPGPPCPSESMGSMVPPSSKSLDNRFPWPLPLASAGIFTSMLTAANSDTDLSVRGKEAHGGIGMAGLSMGISSLSESSLIPQFANSPFLNNGLFPSKHQQQQHTGGALLPATTLLQKAAIMGVTKSDSFLSRNLKDLGSSSPAESWAGMSNSLWHPLGMQPASEGRCLSWGPGCIAGGSSSTLYGGQESAQELRDPARASRVQDVSHPSSSLSSSMTGIFLLDSQKDQQRMEHLAPLHEGSRLHSENTITGTHLEGSQRGETGEVNRMTLDFLGVGDHSLSQRDVNLLNEGVKSERFSPFNDTMHARSGGGDS